MKGSQSAVGDTLSNQASVSNVTGFDELSEIN